MSGVGAAKPAGVSRASPPWSVDCCSLEAELFVQRGFPISISQDHLRKIRAERLFVGRRDWGRVSEISLQNVSSLLPQCIREGKMGWPAARLEPPGKMRPEFSLLPPLLKPVVSSGKMAALSAARMSLNKRARDLPRRDHSRHLTNNQNSPSSLCVKVLKNFEKGNFFRQ